MTWKIPFIFEVFELFSHSKGRSIYDLKEFPGQTVSVCMAQDVPNMDKDW